MPLRVEAYGSAVLFLLYHTRPSAIIPTPSIPTVSEFEVESIEVKENGEGDAESAFYMDLRPQEEGRRRLAASRRIG